MKKTKVLALVLAAAVMMMGAGYAYWTQDLKIENTITTGELEVVFAAPSVTVDNYMNATGTSTFAAADATNHGLVMNLFDAYPGADITARFNLVNEGTMKANVRDFAIATGAVNADLVLCRSLTVGGNVVTLAPNTTLAGALVKLNQLNMTLDVPNNTTQTVVMGLEIDPAANTNLPENSATAISFTINATAHQFNDLAN